jgi:hypothetical protein
VQFSSLVQIQPGEARLPFFWVHGLTSHALLPRYLDNDQPLYGLIHQGQDGKVLYTTVGEIAAHYLRKYALFNRKAPIFSEDIVPAA